MTSFFSAACWIGAYLALVLTPLFVLLLGKVPPGSGFWWDFSMALGFTGMSMMGIQFLLTARFRRACAPFGIDIIYLFHRYLALMIVALIVLHYLIIRMTNVEALGVINPLLASWHMTAGRGSTLLLFILVITSLWRKSLRFHYDEWRMLHIGLSVVVVLLALSHIAGVGYYIDVPTKRWLWMGYIAFWLLLIVHVRLIKPGIMRRKPYRVVEVHQECWNCWTLVLEPDDHEGVPFKPGQFAWLTLRESPYHIKEHPFSFSSSAVDSSRLAFTIKELGDFTRTIKHTEVGTVAYLDGPYGVFTVDRYPNAPGFVFIAGGIGIAPMISMLRTLADRHERRPLWLIYGNNRLENIIFKEVLDTLKVRLNLHIVHVIKDSPADWKGETGVITSKLLQKCLPREARMYEHFLCGPKPMTDAVQRGLHELSVPLGKIHIELYDMV